MDAREGLAPADPSNPIIGKNAIPQYYTAHPVI